MKRVSDIVIKLLGTLILTAAVLKGWQLLANMKEWFVTNPAVALLNNGNVISAWESEFPKLDYILKTLVAYERTLL